MRRGAIPQESRRVSFGAISQDMRTAVLAIVLLSSLILGRPAAAQDRPVLDFPAGCRIGEDCWVFSFVDLKAGDGYTDFRCGARSYEKHKGTDIAVTRVRGPAIGVYAAASGTVVGIRDGEADNPLGSGQTGTPGRDCGNGVRIDHGGGWASQYCHLRRGSIAVQPEQTVEAGALLGLIGNSGRSEIPHLHFQVERSGDTIDPFTGLSPTEAGTCGVGTPLWSAQALDAFDAYRPSHIRQIGFAGDRPTLPQIQRDGSPAALPADGAALVLHTTVYGAPAGTTMTFRIAGPDGATVLERTIDVPERKARQFQFVGRRTPQGGWPPGPYTGDVTVTSPGPDGLVTTTASTQVLLR